LQTTRQSRSIYNGIRKLIKIGKLFSLLILLTGCDLLETQPLPTYAPKAIAPEVRIDLAEKDVPATFTAEALVHTIVTNQPTLTPVPKPTPTLHVTPEPSPTPVVLAALFPQQTGAPNLETLPRTTACNGKGDVFQSRFPSEEGGGWRNYHVYLPSCYGQDGRTYPLVYLIHGSIQTDSHWLDLGLATYADEGIASGRYPPFIAIMPFSGVMGNISSGGSKSIEGVTINYLLPFIESNFCAWKEAAGRTIGGISRGGYWALEIAFSHPELFSAVSGHSSHLRFETDPAKYNPLATYATADLSVMRIWLDRGEKDFLRPGQDQLHNRLTEVGISHEYRINPGGHSDAYWAEHLPEYLDWHAANWPKERNLYPVCNHLG
jgi:enterochelin esterase-like enzyme